MVHDDTRFIFFDTAAAAGYQLQGTDSNKYLKHLFRMFARNRQHHSYVRKEKSVGRAETDGTHNARLVDHD